MAAVADDVLYSLQVNSDIAPTFNDSYDRVLSRRDAQQDGFFSAFYRHLLDASPEAREKFAKTDMNAQVRMLQASVSMLLAFYASGCDNAALHRVAARHTDIGPHLYAVWMDCLIDTVRQFDSMFSAEVETAWRAVFSKGVEFMQSYSGAVL
ncbi:MAG TPA: globin [Bryobacteraceae bacterium]|nr:globin [Bryobacteraceae bacterium]